MEFRWFFVKNKSKFPNNIPKDINSFFSEYMSFLVETKNCTDLSHLDDLLNVIVKVIKNKGTIFVAGNGGSHNIANHLCVDFFKGIANQTDLFPKVVSLSSEGGLLTALANDTNFSEIFSFQLNERISSKDVFIAISSSGNSQNIVNAIKVANKFKASTILFCGFEGGIAKEEAKISIHFPFNNYGIVEDLSQIIMHVLSQYIRMKNLKGISVKEATF